MPRRPPKKSQSSDLPFLIRDTREHEGHGYTWNKSAAWAGTKVRKLDTADYSVEGMERDFFVVERKASVSEWAQCLTSGERAEDFANELVRLDAFAHPFIVCEFSVSQLNSYPFRCGIPQSVARGIRVTGAYLLKLTCEIQMRHRVKIIFAGSADQAKRVVTSLIKRAIECRSAG